MCKIDYEETMINIHDEEANITVYENGETDVYIAYDFDPEQYHFADVDHAVNFLCRRGFIY